jgi:hypothetical protein
MAQKKKKEPQKSPEKKEEKFEWTPPDFDERDFLTKDMKGTKVLLVTALFSFIAGIVAFLLTDTSWILGMAVIIGTIIALRYIYPIFKIDVKAIEKKGWAGNIAMCFLLALGIWIVLMNPPFSDHTNPTLEDSQILVQVGSGNWTVVVNPSTDIYAGQNISFVVNATDMGGIESVAIDLHKQGEQGTFVAMANTEDNRYQYSTLFDIGGNSSAVYYYTIMATDDNGNTAQTDEVMLIINPAP